MGYKVNYKADDKSNDLTHLCLPTVLLPEEQQLSVVSAIYSDIYPIFLNNVYMHFSCLLALHII